MSPEALRPESLAELVDLVRAGTEARTPLEIVGGGTKLGWLRSAGRPATTLDLSGLGGVIEHVAGDMTATVRAGTRLVDLAAALAERGQRLAIDPPLGPGRAATVGGVLGCDDAGPARIAFGSLRELCIGATFVLSDGTVARSGGKVIKNVAGYDLCKLFCGARGTLGVVAEVTLRLHPLSAEEVTLRAPAPPDEAARAAPRFGTGRFAPTAVTTQGGALWLRFEGAGPFVSAQVELAREELAVAGLSPEAPLEGAGSRAAWAEANEARRARAGETTLAITTLPSATPDVLQEMARFAPEARAVADPLLGRALVHLPSAPLPEVAKAAAALRARVHAAQGHLRLRDRPSGLDALFDPFGPLPSSLPLMRAVKAELDPGGRCQPGRYIFEA